VWIFLPLIPEGSWQEVSAETRASAGAAGFEMIDLSGVFEGREAADISLAEWDSHPNALGHRLLAERLFTQLETRRDTLFQPLH